MIKNFFFNSIEINPDIIVITIITIPPFSQFSTILITGNGIT